MIDSAGTDPWSVRFPVGIEEGATGSVLVHALAVPGCGAGDDQAERASERFAVDLSWWLRRIAEEGIAAAPPDDRELEVVVDEWIATEADLEAGESFVCFEADRAPPSDEEISAWLRILGSLRSDALALLRQAGDPWERPAAGGATLDAVSAAHARRQWWLLTRLGASPMAEVPEHPFGRLDTAMALAFQQLGHLPRERRGLALVLDGEEWTPRKVARRMLASERDFLDIVRTALDHDTA